MQYEYKEVYFDQYCGKCKHYGKEDIDNPEDPCSDCLDHPTNLYTHKPTRFEEKK